ncbi:MAG: VOC family protein [Acidobacteria bacterium]|nr:VOC family protein [Acidobacteriota bacterium]
MRALQTLLLVAALAATAQAQTRPSPLGQASITWLYYKDLPAAMRFYEDILGLTLTVDQGWAKVYQTSPTSFIGLVDEQRGMHRASDTKPVAVAFVTPDVDAWHAWLVARGVRMRSAVADSKSLPIRGFTAYDPEGYTLEFELFRDGPQNAKIRTLLKAPR